MEELSLHHDLYQALCEIRKRRIEPSYGICSNLTVLLDLELEWPEVQRLNGRFRVLCTEWPEYSGAVEYPVWTDRSMAPDRQYDRAQEASMMWDRRTDYGKARWRLLDWAIAELEVRIGQK